MSVDALSSLPPVRRHGSRRGHVPTSFNGTAGRRTAARAAVGGLAAAVRLQRRARPVAIGLARVLTGLSVNEAWVVDISSSRRRMVGSAQPSVEKRDPHRPQGVTSMRRHSPQHGRLV